MGVGCWGSGSCYRELGRSLGDQGGSWVLESLDLCARCLLVSWGPSPRASSPLGVALGCPWDLAPWVRLWPVVLWAPQCPGTPACCCPGAEQCSLSPHTLPGYIQCLTFLPAQTCTHKITQAHHTHRHTYTHAETGTHKKIVILAC